MQPQTPLILFPWPSVDHVIDYAGRMVNSLFNGSAYERHTDLPKLLQIPELWLVPGNPTLTETIIADLEGLMAAQVQHLQRGRIHLFDPCRFWALIEARRGEQRIFEQECKRKARHVHAVEEACQAANDTRPAAEE